MQEHTLSIIKPDAVTANRIGVINQRIEQAGLRILALRMLRLDSGQAEGFYAEHQTKAFFHDLVAFMTSGPIVVQVLSGEHAIHHYRALMGATNPVEAAAGTLRADFAQSMERNAVHGSDSAASAQREIACFFTPKEIFVRT